VVDSGTRTGIFFGTTSGVITTLGVIVGLNAGTESLVAVVGGILVIAVADSMSDALGIHLAQESDADISDRQVWAATFSTFFAKFLTALSFAIPFALLSLEVAILVSVAWGYLIIGLLSYRLASEQGMKPLSVIAEHVVIATFVIFASHAIGVWVRNTIG
jgi:VIT1/CCC1 family predicted Fe2+/Mn2+ transporter